MSDELLLQLQIGVFADGRIGLNIQPATPQDKLFLIGCLEAAKQAVMAMPLAGGVVVANGVLPKRMA